MPYIVATCFPKMESRISNRKSLPFIEALRDIKPETISFADSEAKAETRGESHIDAATENDIKFLEAFASEARFPTNMFSSGYDKLLKFASTFTAADRRHFRLYNNDTCQEFHRLLVFLVTTYSCDLQSLRKLQKNRKPDMFRAAAARVNWIGHMLVMLCDGTALPTHLENIEDSLSQRLQEPHIIRHAEDLKDVLVTEHQSTPYVETHYEPEGGQDKVVASDQDDDAAMNKLDQIYAVELDVEVETVQPRVEPSGVPSWPMSKVFLNWLKLMVVHFQATNIITAYFNEDFPVVSIKIMEPLPDFPQETSMLEWRQLFDNKFRWLPLESGPDYPASDITNEEILEFLTSASGPNLRQTAKDILDVKQTWDTASALSGQPVKTLALKMKSRLESVRASTVPGCSGPAELLCDIIEKWVAGAIRPNADPMVIASITAHIERISENCYLFGQFAKTNLQFPGTVHCEACLATLLSRECLDNMTSKELKNILHELKVGRLSHNVFLFVDLYPVNVRDLGAFSGYQNDAALHASCFWPT